MDWIIACTLLDVECELLHPPAGELGDAGQLGSQVTIPSVRGSPERKHREKGRSLTVF